MDTGTQTLKPETGDISRPFTGVRCDGASARFVVELPADPREYTRELMGGILEIERRSPTGYEARATFERYAHKCNRDIDWGLLVARDGVDGGRCVAWLVLQSSLDHMGTAVMVYVAAWCGPRMHEALSPLYTEARRWGKLRGCADQVSYSGRFDQQGKDDVNQRAYRQFIGQFGLKPVAVVYRGKL